MRLSTNQQAAIIAVFGKHIASNQASLYLYGSRTRDDLKGGDIDLLLITSPSHASLLRQEKYKILSEIDQAIGEQRIDLTISSQAEASQDPFLKKILSEAILLKNL